MKIIADRITKDTDANSIKHYYLLDDRISWKAKGIMYFLLNADDDYDYSIQDLAQRSSDGRGKSEQWYPGTQAIRIYGIEIHSE